jgi:hypothetical protein
MSTRPLNVSYLVVGLIFLGISGSWALHASGAVDNADVQWLMPLVLVGAGVIGLVAFTAKGLTRGRGSYGEQQPVGEQPGVDLYGDEPYEPYEPVPDVRHESTEDETTTDQTSTDQTSTDQTMPIEGEDR